MGEFQCNNRHLEGADGARLLANYLVVLLHAQTALQFVDKQTVAVDFWEMVSKCSFALAMPTLFFISGFFMAEGYDRHGFSGLVARRFRRLGVPYLVWNILFILLYIACSFFTAFYAERVEQLDLLSIRGWLRVLHPFAQCVDGPVWYLRSVFILSLAFPLVDQMLKIKKGLLFLFVLIGWCVISHYRNFEDNKLLYSFPAYALVVFSLGAWICRQQINPFVLVRRWSVVLGMAAAIGYSCVVVLFGYKAFWFRNVSLMVSFPALLYFGQIAERVLRGKASYRLFRESAFFVYAIHIIVCPIFSHALAQIFPASATLVVLGYFLMGSALSIGLYYFIGKISLTLRRVLNGEI